MEKKFESINGDKQEKVEISIVIPIYNEEENLPILYERLKSVLDRLGKSYEIIFVMMVVLTGLGK